MGTLQEVCGCLYFLFLFYNFFWFIDNTFFLLVRNLPELSWWTPPAELSKLLL